MDEKIAENVELLNKLVQMMPEGRREKIMAMFDTNLGTQYATAPASSKEHFHECYPGGLLQHSLNVVRNLTKIASALCPDKYEKHQLVFVALFHDLGKAGDGTSDYYVQTAEKWKRDRGELYAPNLKLSPYMPVGDRSVFLLQKHGIELMPDEFIAIKIADGQYEKGNEPYRSKEPELALLVHWADHFSMRQEKLEFAGRSE